MSDDSSPGPDEGTTAVPFDRIVVPVASPEDARATAAALRGRIDPDATTVVAVTVIEKAGGALDTASVEQREEFAEDGFATFLEALGPGVEAIETEVRFDTDVAAAILATAADYGADAVVFTPRGGNRWVKLLTGDVSGSLIAGGDRPVLVLPDVDEGGGGDG